MDESNTQQKENKTSSPMLSRSAQILQAAAPYLDQDSTQMLETVVRMSDFFETIQSIRQHGFSLPFQRKRPGNDTVSMTNLSQAQPQIDAQSLLRSIRPFCSAREGTMIDQIMNIFNIQKAFSMYQTISNMMSMMNSMNGNENSDGSTNSFNPFTNMNGDMSQMMNMASMMSQMMNNNSNAAPEDNSEHSYESDGMNEEAHSSDTTSQQTFESSEAAAPTDTHNYTDNTYNEYYNANTQDTYWNSQNMNYRNNYEPESDIKASNAQPQASAPEADPVSNKQNSNKQMLEMLSSMIPPEQKNTFEAMKILIDSGILK